MDKINQTGIPQTFFDRGRVEVSGIEQEFDVYDSTGNDVKTEDLLTKLAKAKSFNTLVRQVAGYDKDGSKIYPDQDDTTEITTPPFILEPGFATMETALAFKDRAKLVFPYPDEVKKERLLRTLHKNGISETHIRENSNLAFRLTELGANIPLNISLSDITKLNPQTEHYTADLFDTHYNTSSYNGRNFNSKLAKLMARTTGMSYCLFFPVQKKMMFRYYDDRVEITTYQINNPSQMRSGLLFLAGTIKGLERMLKEKNGDYDAVLKSLPCQTGNIELDFTPNGMKSGFQLKEGTGYYSKTNTYGRRANLDTITPDGRTKKQKAGDILKSYFEFFKEDIKKLATDSEMNELEDFAEGRLEFSKLEFSDKKAPSPYISIDDEYFSKRFGKSAKDFLIEHDKMFFGEISSAIGSILANPLNIITSVDWKKIAYYTKDADGAVKEFKTLEILPEFKLSGRNIEDKNVNWAYGIGGGGICRKVSVDKNNNIYFAEKGKNITSLKPDGTINGTFNAQNDILTTPVVVDNFIYFTAGGPEMSYIYKLNLDGSLNMRLPVAYHPSSLSVDENQNIYLGTFQNLLLAFDKDGRKKWECDTDGKIFAAPVKGNKNDIIFGSDEGSLYSINAENGGQNWKFESGGSIKHSPVVGEDGHIYFGNNNGKFFVIDLESGTELRNHILETNANEFNSPVILGNDDSYYFGSNYSLKGFDKDGKTKFNIVGCCMPVFTNDGNILAVDFIDNGNQGTKVKALNVYTPDGKLISTHDISFIGNLIGTPVIDSENNAYLRAEDGTLYSMKLGGDQISKGKS